MVEGQLAEDLVLIVSHRGANLLLLALLLGAAMPPPGRVAAPEFAAAAGVPSDPSAPTRPAETPAAAASLSPLAFSPELFLRDHSYAVITTLQQANAFESAANYALANPTRFQRDLIIAAFHEWGCRQPEQAFAAAAKVPDAPARDLAVQSVLSGWARTDPVALVDAALAFPDGAEKNAALTKAFRAWMVRDPQRAGDWILAHPGELAIAETVFRTENR